MFTCVKILKNIIICLGMFMIRQKFKVAKMSTIGLIKK